MAAAALLGGGDLRQEGGAEGGSGGGGGRIGMGRGGRWPDGEVGVAFGGGGACDGAAEGEPGRVWPHQGVPET
ncbi:MAG: hypothetical protein U0841_20010 [Chloroflexia bacterium]